MITIDALSIYLGNTQPLMNVYVDLTVKIKHNFFYLQ